MKIVRNGVEIELTDDEVEKAYRERKSYYNREDLIHKIKAYCDETDWEDEIFAPDDMEVEIGNAVITVAELQKKIDDPQWMDDLDDSFENALGNNDSYWESFWMTAEAVIEDAIEEDCYGADD